MQFKDIIGQDEVKARLIQSVQEERIPHAQLLTGKSGVGKLQLAIAYAQYIACEHRTETDSCGVCPSCLQYAKLQHPDLHFAFPIYKVKAGKESVCNDFINEWREIVLEEKYFDINDWYQKIGAETKQGVIYEAESGEILRKLSFKAFSGGYKTMIIWLPEKMNVACANKLLKILEEPADKTLFLLVSEEPDLLLPTIISRTQLLKVGDLSEQQITHALTEEYHDLPDGDAANLAHIANGSYLKAKKAALQTQDTNDNLNSFIQLMRNAYSVAVKRDYNALVNMRKWSDSMAILPTGREGQKNFLQYASQQIRENYIYNFGRHEMNYQTRAESEFSVRFAPFITENNVGQIMEQLDLAQRQIEQNGNAKIIFFDLCLQMIVLIKRK